MTTQRKQPKDARPVPPPVFVVCGFDWMDLVRIGAKPFCMSTERADAERTLERFIKTGFDAWIVEYRPAGKEPAWLDAATEAADWLCQCPKGTDQYERGFKLRAAVRAATRS